MFGSDLPYYDFRLVQAQIESAALDDETKERAAYQNAVRIGTAIPHGLDTDANFHKAATDLFRALRCGMQRARGYANRQGTTLRS